MQECIDCLFAHMSCDQALRRRMIEIDSVLIIAVVLLPCPFVVLEALGDVVALDPMLVEGEQIAECCGDPTSLIPSLSPKAMHWFDSQYHVILRGQGIDSKG